MSDLNPLVVVGAVFALAMITYGVVQLNEPFVTLAVGIIALLAVIGWYVDGGS